ncbi:MAG: serpin family protein [Fimbriimonadaceae bacterium]|nr:serpin family protein [Fimbriimonadaceae bacterium]
MKRTTLLVGVISAMVALVGCGGSGRQADSPYGVNRFAASPEKVAGATRAITEGKGAAVANSGNDFGFRLLGELWKDAPNTNLFISPVSVDLALGMTYNGAGGDTKTAMAKTLGVDKIELSQFNEASRNILTVLANPDPKVKLEIANSIWIDKEYKVKADFVSRNESYFGAYVTNLDFKAPEATKTINSWVNENTGEKIPKIVEELDPDAKMMLVNAVYFKGLWSTPFDITRTKDEEFTKFDGKKVSVPMMTRGQEDFLYQDHKDFQGVQIPYGAGQVKMVVLLPKSSTKFADFLKGVNTKNWAAWMKLFKTSQGTVTIPRWKVEQSYMLKDALSGLGMAAAFDPKVADFSGMRQEKDLFINRVIHKTFVEVNEEGTEAAGATGVEMKPTAMPMPDKTFTFKADRPFVYAIIDSKTDIVLFLGVVGDPVGKAESGAKKDGKS